MKSCLQDVLPKTQLKGYVLGSEPSGEMYYTGVIFQLSDLLLARDK